MPWEEKEAEAETICILPTATTLQILKVISSTYHGIRLNPVALWVSYSFFTLLLRRDRLLPEAFDCFLHCFNVGARFYMCDCCLTLKLDIECVRSFPPCSLT